MVNQYPTVRLVFDRKHLASPVRKGVIEIEISFQRRRKWISSDLSVKPENWYPVNRVYGTVDALDLNIRLESQVRPIQNFVRLLQIKGCKDRSVIGNTRSD